MNKSRFWQSQTGATAIEYSLIAAFIALMIVGSLLALEPMLTEPLDTVSNTLNKQ
ncbi:Flp family type IVb pilin [Pseudochrobactrum kiredjianiae]|uniref:Flp family type IVb pilin n=1 Tax=Pseudochrobactrum kiredjianiae TaxID=386305 RepID=A0ABW3V8G1_9HYPH|nr:Flp family type IVb pilin [Pseudochrobactrum kiredjianiae]MDM7851486.1 Flp family type IVb pilin [Pseudochrobactrum kiredjianiae]